MNYDLLIVLVVIDILNFHIFSKGKWYAIDILKKLEKRRFKNLTPVGFTWFFVKIKFAVYIALALAYWTGTKFGGYSDIFGSFKIMVIGLIVSCTFIEDLGYYVLNKEKIPQRWSHVWISEYVPRTPRSVIIFISMIGQILAISLCLL